MEANKRKLSDGINLPFLTTELGKLCHSTFLENITVKYYNDQMTNPDRGFHGPNKPISSDGSD